MKRSLFSLLLVLVLMVAVSVFAAEAKTYDEAVAELNLAAGATADDYPTNLTFHCDHCGSDQTWTKWNKKTYSGHRYVPVGTMDAPSSGLYVRSLCFYIAEGATVRGAQGIKLTRTTSGDASSRLAIMGGGTIRSTGASYPTIDVSQASLEIQVDLYDITVTHTKDQVAIKLNGNQTLNIHDGATVTRNIVNGDTLDGCISATNGATINMSGGTISNGEAATGGNVYLEGSDLIMTGGTISGGKATNHGGNVYVKSGSVTMSGNATITGGEATNHGGNVYLIDLVDAEDSTVRYEAELTMSGNASITAGSAGKNGGNVVVYQNSTFTMNGGTLSVEDGEGNSGTSNNGANIAIMHASSFTGDGTAAMTVSLNGGSILGGAKDGDVVWVYPNYVSEANQALIELGNVTIGNENAFVDIDTVGYVPVKVKSTFADSAVIKYNMSFVDEVFTDGVVASNLAYADGYTDGGNVIIEYADEQYPVVGSGSDLVLSAAATYNGHFVDVVATSAQAAVDAVEDGQYVKLYAPATINLTAPTAVDFNGNAATVTGAANLIGMDAATNDYDENGAAVVTVDTKPALNNEVTLANGTVRKYLALDNGDGTYSFHRYWIGITESALRSSNAANPGIFYKGGFYGDQAVAEAVNAGDWGIKLYYIDNEELKPVAQQYHTNSFKDVAFDSGKDGNGGRYIGLHGYLTNEGMENIHIVAKPYITVGETTIESTVAGDLSMQEALQYAVGQYNEDKLTPAQVTAVDAIFENFTEKFTTLGWDFGYTKKTA